MLDHHPWIASFHSGRKGYGSLYVTGPHKLMVWLCWGKYGLDEGSVLF